MNNFWGNFLLEVGLFTFLGVLYYFYQRKKILNYEASKVPLVMGFMLQSCLAEKTDQPEPQLDTLIESLDDFLSNKSSHPPVSLLKIYAASPKCSEELKAIITEGLLEIEESNDPKK
jgi:hypothetical protein